MSFIPPTLEEIRAYCLQRGNQVDPEAFLDYYSASDWIRNKTKIRDWQACVRTWEKRMTETKASTAPTLLTRSDYVPLNDTCGNWMEA